jgi:hypothetical protein
VQIDKEMVSAKAGKSLASEIFFSDSSFLYSETAIKWVKKSGKN